MTEHLRYTVHSLYSRYTCSLALFKHKILTVARFQNFTQIYLISNEELLYHQQ